MPDEPVWIRQNVALAIHARQVAEHGGDAAIRDLGLLDSALTRPQNLHAYSPSDADLAALAASYAYGIAMNHPFADGNKRTSNAVCRTFLRRNGHDFSASGEEQYVIWMQIAAGERSEDDLGAWIRERLVKLRTEN